jgi:hypothetical protein
MIKTVPVIRDLDGASDDAQHNVPLDISLLQAQVQIDSMRVVWPAINSAVGLGFLAADEACWDLAISYSIRI